MRAAMLEPTSQGASSAPCAAAAVTHARFPGLARRLPWLVLALLAAFPLLAPALGLEYYVGFVRRVLIVAIAATSLNFILGYGGMAALGHAGFIGVGAYTVVALVEAGFSSAWLAWGSAALVAGLAAAAIGAVSLRHNLSFGQSRRKSPRPSSSKLRVVLIRM
jgi:hypothetical protein